MPTDAAIVPRSKETTINDVTTTEEMTPEDLAVLAKARERLENPSLAIRLSGAFGMPVEAVVRQLGRTAPQPVVDAVRHSSQRAIQTVVEQAVRSLEGSPYPAAPRAHTAAVMTTGALGGTFGLAALWAELPVTTAIMFRSIADIARSKGEELGNADTVLQCVQVFALGSNRSRADDAVETTYFGTRVALSRTVSEALQHLATKGAAGSSAPALIRLSNAVAARFGVVVSQKVMAQALPVLGAIGGAGINALFMTHFQQVADAHFAIRQLERRYGAEAVRHAWERP